MITCVFALYAEDQRSVGETVGDDERGKERALVAAAARVLHWSSTIQNL
jgi:hypothetical protein